MVDGELKKVALGHTSLKVTPICFGTTSLGDMPATYGYSVGVGQARATVEAILSSPVNFIDTSRLYSHSEERIGDVLRSRGGLTTGRVIATKLDRDPQTNVFDASQARKSIETSLRKLGLDKVDLLHLHDPEHAGSFSEATSKDGALGELFRMKEEGLATAVGLAMGPVAKMLPLLKQWDFDAVITHNRYTLVNRSANELLNFAKSRGVAVLNAAPYAGGVFARGSADFRRYVYQEANDAALAPVRQIEAICTKHNVPPGAAALQFSLRDIRITSTICGVSSPEHVQQALEWARWQVPAAFWDDIAEFSYSTDDPEATRDYRLG